MILFLKHIAIALAALIGFLAAMLAPVAWISQGISDNPNDDYGKKVSVASFCVFIMCGLLIFMLSGCSDIRTIYHACRDGICR